MKTTKKRLALTSDEIDTLVKALRFYKADNENNLCPDCILQAPEVFTASATEVGKASHLLRRLE